MGEIVFGAIAGDGKGDIEGQSRPLPVKAELRLESQISTSSSALVVIALSFTVSLALDLSGHDRRPGGFTSGLGSLAPGFSRWKTVCVSYGAGQDGVPAERRLIS